MKKIILMLMILLVIPIAIAGTPHTIYGYVSNADDGTLSDGSIVTAYIEGREVETLIDVVGLEGNSQIEGGWLIDTGNFPTEWLAEEKIVVKIEKNGYSAETELILDNEMGNQQAENLTLKEIATENMGEPVNSGGEGTTGGGSSSKTPAKVVVEEPTVKEESTQQLTTPSKSEVEEVKETSWKSETGEDNEISLVENKNSKNLYYLIPIIIVIAIMTIYLFLIRNKVKK